MSTSYLNSIEKLYNHACCNYFPETGCVSLDPIINKKWNQQRQTADLTIIRVYLYVCSRNFTNSTNGTIYVFRFPNFAL